MKGYKKLNTKDYETIKSMLAIPKMKMGIVVQLTKRAYGTIKAIKESSSYQDYRQKGLSAYKARIRKGTFNEGTASTSGTPSFAPEPTQLDRIEGMLELLLKDRRERGWLEKAMGA